MKYNPNIHHRKSIRLKGYDYSQAGLYFITICVQNRLCLFGEIVGANNHSPNNHSPNNHSPNNHSPNNHSPNNHSPKLILNDAGRIANQCWLEIPEHFPNVVLHEHIVMPNHVHGIIELVGANNNSPNNNSPNNNSPDNNSPAPVLKIPEIDSPESVIDMGNRAKNVSNDNGAKNVSNDNGAKNVSNDNGAKNVSPLRSPSKTIGSIVRGYKIGVTKWFRSNGNMENIWQRNYWEHIIRDEQSYQRIAQYIINNPKNWNNDKLNKK